MGQHPDPDDFHDEDLDCYDDEEDLEALGTPVYEGSGLSVRALTAEELQRFLDAHADQPAQRLGSGWGALDLLGRTLGAPRTPPVAGHEPPGPAPPVTAEPIAGSRGRPGHSALAQYRRRRSEELAGWTRGLAWRASLVAAAGLVAGVLAGQAGLPGAGLGGLAVAVLVGWRLRFRPSEQARAWQRGAAGERQTARLLDRLGRDGYVVFHDLALPDSPANLDHLVVGPSGVFVVDSKRWTGSVHKSADGLIWHDHYRLDRTLATICWQAETLGRLLGRPGRPAHLHPWRRCSSRWPARPRCGDRALVPASLGARIRPGSVGGRHRAVRRDRPDAAAPCRLTKPASVPAPPGQLGCQAGVLVGRVGCSSRAAIARNSQEAGSGPARPERAR